MKEYSLTVNEQQLQVIAKACELLYRTDMGQFNVLEEHLDNCGVSGDKYNREAAEQLLQSLKALTKPKIAARGQYLGIRSPELSEEAKICCDIEQVIRHTLACENNPQGGMQVYCREPTQYSNEPLPVLKKEVD